MFSAHRFISFDKTPIFYRTFKTTSPKAVALIVHGMGEHGGRYAHVARALNDTGCDVFAPDLRGFGESGGRRGCIRRFSDFHEDLKALHTLIKKKYPGTPVFLIGHSMGGLVASSYAAEENPVSLSGLVLSSPLFRIAVPVPPARVLLAQIASLIAPDFVQNSGIDSAQLTHDAQVLDAYKKDSLIHYKVSARLYLEMVKKASEWAGIAGNVRIPTLIMQAGDDKIVSKQATFDFFNGIKCKSKDLVVYDNFYHEIFNETDKSIPISKLTSWVKENILK